jgi:hypothetical protein
MHLGELKVVRTRNFTAHKVVRKNSCTRKKYNQLKRYVVFKVSCLRWRFDERNCAAHHI